MQTEINTHKSKNYTGVFYFPRYRRGQGIVEDRWRAQIVINGKPRYLGLFEDEDDAGRAVDCARICLQEFFARSFDSGKLNRPIEEQQGITSRVEKLQRELEAEGAPRYRHLAAGEGHDPLEELRQMLGTLKPLVARLESILAK